MKILHTSDWHIGHRLCEQSQEVEQLLFFDWLISKISDQKADVLLVSGDIFDTASPSPQSQKIYYNFLTALQKTTCKKVVITGGNHDSPSLLNAPHGILTALNIHIVGKAPEEISDEIFSFSLGDENLIVAAVPYLRDRDIRKAVAGESFDAIGERYKTALVRHYSQVGEICEQIKLENSNQKKNTCVIAMGHLFAIGGSVSESEQSIYVGNLGDISAENFPEIFDYIALGHLHRPQKVAKKEYIRYSGSPYILSFSELKYPKKVCIIETENSQIIPETGIQTLEIPRFRKIYQIKGTPENCKNKINEIVRISGEDILYNLIPWAEIIFDSGTHYASANADIREYTKNMKIEILKISTQKGEENLSSSLLYSEEKEVKDLSPLEVFKERCTDQGFSLKDNPEILDAFSEAWDRAKMK